MSHVVVAERVANGPAVEAEVCGTVSEVVVVHSTVVRDGDPLVVVKTA
ncbi:MAG TPA: hypothetical protein PKD84_11325 [Propionicimonas sp.]|nr:hypothetical protein [Propionicimonas sp.]